MKIQSVVRYGPRCPSPCFPQLAICRAARTDIVSMSWTLTTMKTFKDKASSTTKPTTRCSMRDNAVTACQSALHNLRVAPSILKSAGRRALSSTVSIIDGNMPERPARDALLPGVSRSGGRHDIRRPLARRRTPRRREGRPRDPRCSNRPVNCQTGQLNGPDKDDSGQAGEH